MPKFILIDHSLHRPGGHHFDYAVQVLSAAEKVGYQITIAANRRWSCSPLLPQHWPVLPFFPHPTYTSYSVLSGKADYPCNPFGASTGDVIHTLDSKLYFRDALRRCQNLFRRWDQRRRAQAFASSCARLLHTVTLQSDDQVFLPTISDFDLVGLTLFLRQFRQRSRTNWHVQFHFNFLEGSNAKYSKQSDRIDRMSDHFRELLQELNDVPLHFYATTPELAEQYNLLHVAPFHLLHYPVNPLFLKSNEQQSTPCPLRVLCAGGLREEKGSHELAQLMEKTNALGLAGQLQFWVQAKRASRVPVAAHQRYELRSLNHQPPASARVVCVPHPLEPDDYVRLLRSAHIGLFLYDADRYYTRCSGILVELLTAGVPVIVPAGCWLGQQLLHPAACGVGLIANDRSEVPRLLAEMTQQYEHFAAAARAFAPRYFAMHRPEDVIATLERTARESRERHLRAA